jgi:hypothetical protein
MTCGSTNYFIADRILIEGSSAWITPHHDAIYPKYLGNVARHGDECWGASARR